jgi:hypothetical protein
MKLVIEYLADAAKFEQLAASEQDPQVRELCHRSMHFVCK